MGASAPASPWPKALPWASSGAKARLAAASIRSWARTPAPRRSTSRRRVDAAKPNSAWWRASPASPPTARSAASFPSTATASATTQAAVRNPANAATLVCGRGGSGAADAAVLIANTIGRAPGVRQ